MFNPIHPRRGRPAVAWLGRGAALLLLALLLAGCTATGVIITPTDTASPGASATATATTATSFPVKVYFSKHPETDSNVTAVFPVGRVSPTIGVATYALQQLILGPTASEAASGYFTELPASLTGASNCGGPDFTYTIDNATHTGKLQFCKQTQLAGDLVGPRIKAEINATLTQFPNVTKVIILNSSGHCFDDLQGADSCLH